MNIKQYYLGCLSHASYMISDESSKTAVIVDPQRDVDQYVQDAKDQGLTIKDVVLTHFHADFVAGHLELQKRTGAEINLGAAAHPDYPFHPRREGEDLTFGQTRLHFLETPGHTPEAMALVAYDLAKDPRQPQAVLTGDTLFVGDVGRPDLAVSAGHSPQALAGQLFDSLHDKLLTLPDTTIVYPAHGPGSLCGSGTLAGKVSTIGRERAENPMLQSKDKEAFVTAITSHLPELPPYFAHDANLNQISHATLDESVAQSNRPLTVAQVADQIKGGAQLLDVRSPDEFAAGHWKNSLNVGIDGRFAQWAGTLLDPSKPVVVIASPGREKEAITRLGRIGSDQVAGYLEGGLEQLTVPQARTNPTALAAQLAGDRPPAVIDVRGVDEFRGGHIEGSRNIPLAELSGRLAELPADRPLVVHCQSGYRSSMAVSLLARQGLTCVTDLMGGIAAWKEQGLPILRNV